MPWFKTWKIYWDEFWTENYIIVSCWIGCIVKIIKSTYAKVDETVMVYGNLAYEGK